MNGLIYTPRQTDFLKDGSIFAQSPAKTCDTAVKPHLPTADSNRFASFAKCIVTLCSLTGLLRTSVPYVACNASGGTCMMKSAAFGHRSASAGAPQAPVLHAPQPRFPTYHSQSKLVWAPQAAGSPQLPTVGQDDMAQQIRAKFENLVRASPLPKVDMLYVKSLLQLTTCSCFSFILPLACMLLYRWLSTWSVHGALSRLL